MNDLEASPDPRQPRLPADHPVQYRVRGSRTAAIEMGQIVDISESGLRLCLAHKVEPEDVLDLEIAAAGDLIQARGQVARVDATDDGSWAVGLRWLGIATENLYALLYSR